MGFGEDLPRAPLVETVVHRHRTLCAICARPGLSITPVLYDPCFPAFGSTLFSVRPSKIISYIRCRDSQYLNPELVSLQWRSALRAPKPPTALLKTYLLMSHYHISKVKFSEKQLSTTAEEFHSRVLPRMKPREAASPAVCYIQDKVGWMKIHPRLSLHTLSTRPMVDGLLGMPIPRRETGHLLHLLCRGHPIGRH